MAADLMRLQFHERRKAHRDRPEAFILDTDGMAWMGLWYGTLYVVVEGWQTLGLHDKQIDELLTSSNAELLRRYRNGMFHFQKDPFDNRFVEFMDEPSTPEWVRTLHGAFGRWCDEMIKDSFGGEIPEDIRNLPANLNFPEWVRGILARAAKPPEKP
jgi:hypothetical protein